MEPQGKLVTILLMDGVFSFFFFPIFPQIFPEDNTFEA
jgi:hypothetical protein